jgi:hypothetical protein
MEKRVHEVVRLFLSPANNRLDYHAGAKTICVICDTASGAFTVTMPDLQLAPDQTFVFYNIGSVGNLLTVTGAAINTIDNPSITVSDGKSATLISTLYDRWLTQEGDIPAHTHDYAASNHLHTGVYAPVTSKTRAVIIESDCCSANIAGIPGLLGAAQSSGTSSGEVGNANHPGVINLLDSTTGNGGYRYMTDTSAFLIAGGENSVFVFKPRGVRAGESFRLGFQDSTAIQTQPTDGVWFQYTANGTTGTILGRCKNNAGPTDTNTSYNTTVNTWYVGTIDINAVASLVTFTIYDAAGAVLWTNTVSGNIPKAAGRECGWGMIAGETSTDAAAIILSMDYLRLEIVRDLVR